MSDVKDRYCLRTNREQHAVILALFAVENLPYLEGKEIVLPRNSAAMRMIDQCQ